MRVYRLAAPTATPRPPRRPTPARLPPHPRVTLRPPRCYPGAVAARGVHPLIPTAPRMDHLVFRHDLDQLAMYEQMASFAPSRDAEVGALGLARTVDHAAHDGNLDCKIAITQGFLRACSHVDDVYLSPST